MMYLIISIFFLNFLGTAFALVPDIAKFDAEDLPQVLRERGPWDFTQHENKLILKHLQDQFAKYRMDFSPLPSIGGAFRGIGVEDSLLMRFGDVEQMEAVIEHYFTVMGPPSQMFRKRYLIKVGHPELILKLGDRLCATEPPFEHLFADWQRGVLNDPYLSAEIFLGNIMVCGYFTRDAREWARTTLRDSRGGIEMPEILPEIKRFWEENHEAIRSQNYDAVRPPSAIPR